MLREVLNVKTIVVCTDLTPASNPALVYAKRFTVDCGARLLLLHIVDSAAVSSEEMDVSTLELDDTIASAKNDLRQISTELAGQGAESRWIVRHGNVRNLILEVVRESHGDLLVLGGKSMNLEGRSRPGTVGEQLVRAAPCPVLTVVPDARWRDLENGHHRLLLVPTDFSEDSQAALLYALAFAQSVGASLLIVHAVEYQSAKPVGPHLAELRTKGMHMLVAYAHAAHVQAESIVRKGDACEVILSLARERKADYIVVGVRGGSLVDGTRLHGKAQELLRQSPCPVLSIYSRSSQASPAKKEHGKISERASANH